MAGAGGLEADEAVEDAFAGLGRDAGAVVADPHERGGRHRGVPSRFQGPGCRAGAFDAFLHEWQTQVGDGFPMPNFSSATVGDFRVRPALGCGAHGAGAAAAQEVGRSCFLRGRLWWEWPRVSWEDRTR